MVQMFLKGKCLSIALFGNIWMVLAQKQMIKYVSELNTFVDHGFKNVAATSVSDCGVACVYHKSCYSFSYNRGTGNCQLNDKNPFYDEPFTKTNLAGWISYYGQCLQRWVGYGGSCYLLVNTPHSWVNSEANCVRQGSHLADIQDRNEERFLYQQLSPSGLYWIGLNDMDEEGRYVWTSSAPVAYTTSLYAYMDAANEDCVSIYGKDDYWHTDPCYHELSSICKYDI